MLASSLLLRVLVIIAAIVIYLGFKNDEINYLLVIFLAVLIMGVYVFQHPINLWWDKRFGVKVEHYESQWMEDTLPFLRKHDSETRQRLKEVITLTVRHIEFIPMGEFAIPEETKIMAVAPAIGLGIHQNPKILQHYQRVVFYKHPFITPQSDRVHVFEIHEEDGVIIFSTQHLEAGYLNPRQFFHISLYAWIEIANKHQMGIKTRIDRLSEEEIERKLGYRLEKLRAYLGVDELNIDSLSRYMNWIEQNS